MNILWQAGDLNLKWLYTVQPLFYIFEGATQHWRKIQENVKFGKCSYGHLAGTIQKVCKITENAECGNVKVIV
jgi:hypothetical protein